MANWTGIGEIGKEEIIGDPMTGEERGTERTTDTVDPMETVDPMVDPTEAEDPMEAVGPMETVGPMEDPMEGCRY
jgi:hypothetical protein